MKWLVQEMMDEHVNGKILKRVREDSSRNDESKESNIQHLQECRKGKAHFLADSTTDLHLQLIDFKFHPLARLDLILKPNELRSIYDVT
jgi:hypothetical protein